MSISGLFLLFVIVLSNFANNCVESRPVRSDSSSLTSEEVNDIFVKSFLDYITNSDVFGIQEKENIKSIAETMKVSMPISRRHQTKSPKQIQVLNRPFVSAIAELVALENIEDTGQQNLKEKTRVIAEALSQAFKDTIGTDTSFTDEIRDLMKLFAQPEEENNVPPLWPADHIDLPGRVNFSAASFQSSTVIQSLHGPKINLQIPSAPEEYDPQFDQRNNSSKFSESPESIFIQSCYNELVSSRTFRNAFYDGIPKSEAASLTNSMAKLVANISDFSPIGEAAFKLSYDQALILVGQAPTTEEYAHIFSSQTSQVLTDHGCWAKDNINAQALDTAKAMVSGLQMDIMMLNRSKSDYETNDSILNVSSNLETSFSRLHLKKSSKNNNEKEYKKVNNLTSELIKETDLIQMPSVTDTFSINLEFATGNSSVNDSPASEENKDSRYHELTENQSKETIFAQNLYYHLISSQIFSALFYNGIPRAIAKEYVISMAKSIGSASEFSYIGITTFSTAYEQQLLLLRENATKEEYAQMLASETLRLFRDHGLLANNRLISQAVSAAAAMVSGLLTKNVQTNPTESKNFINSLVFNKSVSLGSTLPAKNFVNNKIAENMSAINYTYTTEEPEPAGSVFEQSLYHDLISSNAFSKVFFDGIPYPGALAHIFSMIESMTNSSIFNSINNQSVFDAIDKALVSLGHTPDKEEYAHAFASEIAHQVKMLALLENINAKDQASNAANALISGLPNELVLSLEKSKFENDYNDSLAGYTTATLKNTLNSSEETGASTIVENRNPIETTVEEFTQDLYDTLLSSKTFNRAFHPDMPQAEAMANVYSIAKLMANNLQFHSIDDVAFYDAYEKAIHSMGPITFAEDYARVFATVTAQLFLAQGLLINDNDKISIAKEAMQVVPTSISPDLFSANETEPNYMLDTTLSYGSSNTSIATAEWTSSNSQEIKLTYDAQFQENDTKDVSKSGDLKLGKFLYNELISSNTFNDAFHEGIPYVVAASQAVQMAKFIANSAKYSRISEQVFCTAVGQALNLVGNSPSGEEYALVFASEISELLKQFGYLDKVNIKSQAAIVAELLISGLQTGLILSNSNHGVEAALSNISTLSANGIPANVTKESVETAINATRRPEITENTHTTDSTFEQHLYHNLISMQIFKTNFNNHIPPKMAKEHALSMAESFANTPEFSSIGLSTLATSYEQALLLVGEVATTEEYAHVFSYETTRLLRSYGLLAKDNLISQAVSSAEAMASGLVTKPVPLTLAETKNLTSSPNDSTPLAVTSTTGSFADSKIGNKTSNANYEDDTESIFESETALSILTQSLYNGLMSSNTFNKAFFNGVSADRATLYAFSMAKAIANVPRFSSVSEHNFFSAIKNALNTVGQTPYTEIYAHEFADKVSQLLKKLLENISAKILASYVVNALTSGLPTDPISSIDGKQEPELVDSNSPELISDSVKNIFSENHATKNSDYQNKLVIQEDFSSLDTALPFSSVQDVSGSDTENQMNISSNSIFTNSLYFNLMSSSVFPNTFKKTISHEEVTIYSYAMAHSIASDSRFASAEISSFITAFNRIYNDLKYEANTEDYAFAYSVATADVLRAKQLISPGRSILLAAVASNDLCEGILSAASPEKFKFAKQRLKDIKYQNHATSSFSPSASANVLQSEESSTVIQVSNSSNQTYFEQPSQITIELPSSFLYKMTRNSEKSIFDRALFYNLLSARVFASSFNFKTTRALARTYIYKIEEALKNDPEFTHGNPELVNAYNEAMDTVKNAAKTEEYAKIFASSTSRIFMEKGILVRGNLIAQAARASNAMCNGLMGVSHIFLLDKENQTFKFNYDRTAGKNTLSRISKVEGKTIERISSSASSKNIQYSMFFESLYYNLLSSRLFSNNFNFEIPVITEKNIRDIAKSITCEPQFNATNITALMKACNIAINLRLNGAGQENFAHAVSMAFFKILDGTGCLLPERETIQAAMVANMIISSLSKFSSFRKDNKMKGMDYIPNINSNDNENITYSKFSKVNDTLIADNTSINSVTVSAFKQSIYHNLISSRIFRNVFKTDISQIAAKDYAFAMAKVIARIPGFDFVNVLSITHLLEIALLSVTQNGKTEAFAQALASSMAAFYFEKSLFVSGRTISQAAAVTNAMCAGLQNTRTLSKTIDGANTDFTSTVSPSFTKAEMHEYITLSSSTLHGEPKVPEILKNYDHGKVISDFDNNELISDFYSNDTNSALGSNEVISQFDSNKAIRDFDSHEVINDFDSNKYASDYDSSEFTTDFDSNNVHGNFGNVVYKPVDFSNEETEAISPSPTSMLVSNSAFVESLHYNLLSSTVFKNSFHSETSLSTAFTFAFLMAESIAQTSGFSFFNSKHVFTHAFYHAVQAVGIQTTTENFAYSFAAAIAQIVTEKDLVTPGDSILKAARASNAMCYGLLRITTQKRTPKHTQNSKSSISSESSNNKQGIDKITNGKISNLFEKILSSMNSKNSKFNYELFSRTLFTLSSQMNAKNSSFSSETILIEILKALVTAIKKISK